LRPDPYRTLGLPASAPIEEVKRAYRNLAKRYHPDAGGDEATARFLAIQAAYEAILGGGGRGGALGRPAAPWEADAGRARATRETYRRSGRGSRATGWGRSASPDGAAGGPSAGTSGGASNGQGPGTWWAAGPDRTRRSRSRPAAGRGADGAPGTNGASGPARGARPASGSGSAPGSTSPGSGPTSGAGGGRSRRRSPTRRKATLTSTSYDEAGQGPFEPDWQGGSWYGTSSGTYWTLNPREYADPRKHGPEYQARARRGHSEPSVRRSARPAGATTPETVRGDPSNGPAGSSGTPRGRPAGPRRSTAEPDPGADAFRPTVDGHPPTRAPVEGSAGPRPVHPRPPEPAGPRGSSSDEGRHPIGARPGTPSGGASPVTIGLAAGAVALVPSAVLLLGAGPTAAPATVMMALALPLATAVGAGIVTLVVERDHR
jgi:curved DNA-binding protein CbpA